MSLKIDTHNMPHDISLHENFFPTKPNYPLKLQRSMYADWYNTYWHEQLEIIYFQQGDGTFVMGGKEYNITPGDIYVINCNDLHTFKTETSTLNFSITIDLSFFDNVEYEYILFQPYIKDDKFLQSVFEEVFEEYFAEKESWDMAVMGKVYKLVTYLIRSYRQDTLSQKDYDSRNLKLKRLQEVLEYISLHYSEKISTSDVSEVFHINKYYLCKTFKEETGQTPIEYMNDFRVKRSLPLLKSTTESIAGIAETVGFEDANYFSRIFKKIMHMSPMQYRNSQN